MRFVHCLGLTALATSALLSLPAHAEKTMITGKQDLVCATQYAMACVDGSVCRQGPSNSFDLAAFLFVDAKKKQIRGIGKDRSEVTSKIMQSDITERSFILQGFENHNGWSMGIDRIDGSYTLSVTGPDINFTVMGACTTR
jgi:hypothetical protein